MLIFRKPQLIFFFILLLTGCFYHPDGVFVNKIIPPTTSGISINLNTSGDTLYLYSMTTLNYTMDPAGHTIYEADVNFNNYNIYTSREATGSFTINPFLYNSGTYALTLKLIVYSGNGSLADKLGQELVNATMDFVVIIDVLPPTPPTTILDTTGGTMTLHWTRYAKPNFQSYTITKCEQCDAVVITDRDVTSWNDTKYVGGSVTYYVSVQASSGVAGQTVSFAWWPRMRFSIQNKKATLSWQRPFFYKNTTGVQIAPFSTSFQPVQALADTTFQVPNDLRFGISYDGLIRFNSSDPNQYFEFDIPFYVGHLYTSSLPMAYNPHANVFYTYVSSNFGTTIGIEDDSLGYVNTVAVMNFQLSADGNHMVAYNIDPNNISTLSEVNPLTLEKSNPFNTGKLTTVGGVGNNGLIACFTYAARLVLALPDYHVIYTGTAQAGQFMISPSGQFLIENNNVYKFDGSAFQNWGTINTTQLNAITFTETDNPVLAYQNGTVNQLDIQTLSVLKTVATPLSGVDGISYDPVSKKSLARNYQQGYYLIDFVAGVSHKVSNVQTTLLNGKVYTYLINDITLGSSGVVSIDNTFFQ